MSTFSVTTGPVLPIAPPPSTNVSPGNGFSPILQGTSVATVTAVGTIQAFSPVAVTAGGAAPLSNNNTGAWIGIALTSASAGASVPVAFSGIIVGSSWNFVIGLPVFANGSGIITQTQDGVDNLFLLGIAVSANSINLQVAGTNHRPAVLISSSSGNTPIHSNASSFFEVTMAANTNLVFDAGTYSGQEILVAVVQGTNTVASFAGAVVPSNFVQSTVAGKVDILRFSWVQSKSLWYATAIFTGA